MNNSNFQKSTWNFGKILLAIFVIGMILASQAQAQESIEKKPLIRISHTPHAKLGKQALNKSIYHKWSDARYVQELQSLPKGGFLKINLRDYNDNTTKGNERLEIYVINAQTDRIVHHESTIAGRRNHDKPSYLELSNKKQTYSINACLPYDTEIYFGIVWRGNWYIFNENGKERKANDNIPNCTESLEMISSK